MTEITRVPLQPIAKGSLGKLWLGVAVVALAAGGLAWAATPPLVDVQTIAAGKGPAPTLNDVAVVNYKGSLSDGKVFDQGQAQPLPLQGLIPGFTKALMQMQSGGQYRIHIPASQAYGEKGIGEIPPNSDLTFDIEVLGFMPREQYLQQMQMMQQMQQMQQGGAPGGAEGAPPHP